MARKKRPASAMRRLHRSLGAGAALFVIFLVLSGLAINHSNGLGLDQRYVSQAFLLSWYGLDEPDQVQSFAVGSDWLSFAGSQLYLNGKIVATMSTGVGAVHNGDMLIAAGSDELLLVDLSGNLIERLSWGPAGATQLESIGTLDDGMVIVKSAQQLWKADANLLSWTQAGNVETSPRWSVPEPAPEMLLRQISQQYRGNGPSLERLLLDLHSGRIFGPLGILVYDLLALAIGFLAISGLVLWTRGKRNGKRR